MSRRDIELALRKQRLRFKSAALRDALAQDCLGLTPLFTVADRVRAATGWLREHPQVLVGLATTLLVAKPRTVLGWSRRGFFAWQTWRRLRA